MRSRRKSATSSSGRVPGGPHRSAFTCGISPAAQERLLTYARGEALTAAQLAAARREAMETPTADVVVAEVREATGRALDQVRATPRDMLLTERKVGRAGLPSTTLGLLFHAAEHATRHAGQAITTAKASACFRAGLLRAVAQHFAEYFMFMFIGWPLRLVVIRIVPV